jgi:hypothetical protein
VARMLGENDGMHRTRAAQQRLITIALVKKMEEEGRLERRRRARDVARLVTCLDGGEF